MLPTFDTANGFTPEYLHSVCQGVVRQMSNLWFNSCNSQEDFYLGRQVGVVGARLGAICLPSEVTRALRSIKDRKYRKASEWRAFMLYSLVVLNGLLPNVYMKHFFLLVQGVYFLLGNKINVAMLSHAKKCLTNA